MPAKTKVRSKKPSARRRPGAGPQRRSRTLVEVKRWWEKVKPLGPHYGPRTSSISCAAPISEQSGSELIYHDISTKYATWPSGAYVDFVSFPFAFGLGVPVNYTSTSAGYSFSGHIPVCTQSSVCTNGQPMVWQVDVAGEVKTSGEPDEMSYTYSIDVFCGGVLTCTENGTFKGTRKTGTADSLEGSFHGAHAWTLKCCPKRHAPTP
jgi:hypothetical protein